MKPKAQLLNRVVMVLAFAVIVASVAYAQSKEKQLSEAAQAELIAASTAYRESLAQVLELQRQDDAHIAELVEKRRSLLALGSISKREVEEAEQTRKVAQTKMNETLKKMEDVDRLLAEVSATEQPKQPTTLPLVPPGNLRITNALVRYVGVSHWGLGNFDKVAAYFQLQFRKPLPVSAFGQTETHNRLGFDHRQAIDVAIHPDSNEGQTLIAYLRAQGISFIAIRQAIPGAATGAHIHIGLPSKRIVWP